ncbi:MAG: hypothetical protein ABI895_23125 [Deltaproteobacteria bacterium]
MSGPGERVRFRIGDVFAPPAEDLLAALFADRILEGEIVSNASHDAFGPCAVVKVREFDHLVIISTQDLP